MRILVLSPSFYLPDQGVRIGGGEISNFLLLDQLAKKGHEVCVVSIHGTAGNGDTVRGTTLFNISSKIPVPIAAKSVATARYRSEAAKIARRFRPDVILAITSATATGIALKETLQVPLGVLLRAENDLVKSQDGASGLKSLFLKTFLGASGDHLLNEADFLIVNSEYMKRAFSEKNGNAEIHVVYPPVDDEQRPFKAIDKFSQIVSVGTSPRKGFGLIRELASRLPEIRFHVVGDPAIPPGSSEQHGNLKVSGWMGDRSEYLDPADLVLVPSEWNEPFGRIAVEALRYGRCVLVSDRGGLPEILDHHRDLVVQSNDPVEWVARIGAVNKNPDYFTEISRQAAAGTSRFLLKEQVDAMEQILEHQVSNN